MYLILDVARYAGGMLDQSYCQEMTLAVWFTLFMSPGSSLAYDNPRLGFFFTAGVLEGMGLGLVAAEVEAVEEGPAETKQKMERI